MTSFLPDVCTRRTFLRVAAAAGAALAGAGGIAGLEGCAAPRLALGPRRRRVLADLHVHPALQSWIARSPISIKVPGAAGAASRFLNHTRAGWEACHRAGVDVLCVAHYNPFDELASMGTDPSADAPANLLRMMDLLEEELSLPPVSAWARIARSAAELEQLLEVPKESPDFRVAVVHTVEGAHALGGSLRPLSELARRGVFSIGVTHFFNKGTSSAPNAIPYFPDAGSSAAPVGLSPFGRDLVREMERADIVPDVTHCTREGIEDILGATGGPLLASHSGLRTLSDHPYNLVDEHVEAIAQRGGLVALPLIPHFLSNYIDVDEAESRGSPADLARSAAFARNLLRGTSGLPRAPHEYIAIGSDFGGYLPRVTGIRDVAEIEVVRQELGRHLGVAASDAILDDILAGNAIRFLRDHWGRRRG